MSTSINTQIQFYVCLNGIEHKVITQAGEYRNLMVLFKDKFYPDDFGQCGGQGRCATCLIKIKHSSTLHSDSGRNEQATLNKMGIHNPEIRLSCQILIDHDLDNLKVDIIENDY